MAPTRRELMRSAAAAGAWLLAGAPAAGRDAARAPRGGSEVRARILGIAQDGGLPHLGCDRACCVRARRDASRALKVASLGLSVAPAGPLLLVDATPDLPAQVHALREASGLRGAPGRPMDGILLTHAHVGHYAGLIHLGREAAAARAVPLLATERMCAFLRESKPWSLLLEAGNVELSPLEPGTRVALAEDLHAEVLPVPHRDEASDTIGFIFSGPSRRLLYVPDTDAWTAWPRPIRDFVAGVDVAVLDGTFFDASEVTWRDPGEIPHPYIRTSMDLLEAGVREGRRVLFTHLNHSNPALDPGSEAAAEIGRRGFGIAAEGMEFVL